MTIKSAAQVLNAPQLATTVEILLSTLELAASQARYRADSGELQRMQVSLEIVQECAADLIKTLKEFNA